MSLRCFAASRKSSFDALELTKRSVFTAHCWPAAHLGVANRAAKVNSREQVPIEPKELGTMQLNYADFTARRELCMPFVVAHRLSGYFNLEACSFISLLVEINFIYKCNFICAIFSNLCRQAWKVADC